MPVERVSHLKVNIVTSQAFCHQITVVLKCSGIWWTGFFADFRFISMNNSFVHQLAKTSGMITKIWPKHDWRTWKSRGCKTTALLRWRAIQGLLDVVPLNPILDSSHPVWGSLLQWDSFPSVEDSGAGRARRDSRFGVIREVRNNSRKHTGSEVFWKFFVTFPNFSAEFCRPRLKAEGPKFVNLPSISAPDFIFSLPQIQQQLFVWQRTFFRIFNRRYFLNEFLPALLRARPVRLFFESLFISA